MAFTIGRKRPQTIVKIKDKSSSWQFTVCRIQFTVYSLQLAGYSLQFAVGS